MTIAIIPPIRIPKEERDRRLAAYRTFASPGTEIILRNLKGGPSLTDSEYDLFQNGSYMISEAQDAENAGVNAVVLDCTADPVIVEISQALNIPVVGALAAGLHMAMQLSRQFSVLALDANWARMIGNRIRFYSMETRLCSIETVGSHVYQPPGLNGSDSAGSDKFYKLLLQAGHKALAQGAESVVLGSTTVIEGVRDLEIDLGIPVIAPGPAALKTAEMFVYLGLRPSRLSFPYPVSLSS